MSDRELLKLAAKAAGIRINYWLYDDLDYSAAVLETSEIWHPLADGSDALSLAVKLGLTVAQLITSREVYVFCYHEETVEMYEDYGTDPDAATRLAITRAAAEVGRNMK